jgi:hypothetical protein
MLELWQNQFLDGTEGLIPEDYRFGKAILSNGVSILVKIILMTASHAGDGPRIVDMRIYYVVVNNNSVPTLSEENFCFLDYREGLLPFGSEYDNYKK